MPPKKIPLRREIDYRRPENVGDFDKYSAYNKYDVRRMPLTTGIPTTGYEVSDEVPVEEETLLSKQVKNAVNTYFNEREELRYTADYMKQPINDPVQSLDTEGPVFVRGKIAPRKYENLDVGQLNAGTVYKNKPNRTKVKKDVVSNNGGFIGNNYNYMGLKDETPQRLTKAEIKQGIINPKTKQKIPRKYTGKVSDATRLQENPKPSGLTWYQMALAEYKKQKRAEKAFYSGRIKKGTPEYDEVMAIAELLKNS